MLAASVSHPSVNVIVSAVRERLGDGTVQTVYNALRAFADIPCLTVVVDSISEIDETEATYWGR